MHALSAYIAGRGANPHPLHHRSIQIYSGGPFGILFQETCCCFAPGAGASTRCYMLFFHKFTAAAASPGAPILGTNRVPSQVVATKLCGQKGQSANVVKKACRRSLRRAAWKVALSRRSGLPRKTASFFMRPINFRRLVSAIAKSSSVKRRCRSMR